MIVSVMLCAIPWNSCNGFIGGRWYKTYVFIKHSSLLQDLLLPHFTAWGEEPFVIILLKSAGYVADRCKFSWNCQVLLDIPHLQVCCETKIYLFYLLNKKLFAKSKSSTSTSKTWNGIYIPTVMILEYVGWNHCSF